MNTTFDLKEANAQVLAYVRRESLDIYNRLHSVLEDTHFVEQVHRAYIELPILPNLRCGAWYVDPQIAARERAYFKSTDGHFGNWNFNLRRPNLHLLPLVVAGHGMIIVDSTRAGKRIPDALSKTVPTWCAVINRATFLLHPTRKDWDLELYCPPGAVSEQERSQIKEQLEDWAQSLVQSSYALPALAYPLRPLWITPSTSVFPCLPAREKLNYLPIICVSASKQVHDGVERRSNGFSYVQGSGDDHELWGMGLTPQLFWDNKDHLLRSPREDLHSVVRDVVAQSKSSQTHNTWNSLPTPVAGAQGRLLVGTVADTPTNPPSSIPGIDGSASFVLVSAGVPEAPSDSYQEDATRPDATPSPNEGHVLRLRLAEGKKDQIYFLQTILPASTAYINARLARGDFVCICCDSGKDASVGIALAALSLFFDDNGQLVEQGTQSVCPTKQSIRTRLQWIISSRPEANPSRVTLKRVNEFLLSSPAFRRK